MQLTYDDTFNPGYSGKLFVVKPAKINYTLSNDVDAATPEGKEIHKIVDSLWRTQMDAFKKTKEKEYLDAIKATEAAIIKSVKLQKDKIQNPAKWLDGMIEGANKMIEKALIALESVVDVKARELYDKAAASVDKKFKTKIRNMKLKAALKIGAHVVLIVAAGALAVLAAVAGVAVSVFTSGAGAVTFLAIIPVIATALGAATKSVLAIKGTIQREWPNEVKAGKNLEKTMQALIAAVELEQEKQRRFETTGKKLSLIEKGKLLFNNVKGKREAVLKAIDTLDTFTGRFMQKIEEYAKGVEELERQLEALEAKAKGASAEVEKQSAKLVKKMSDLLYKIGSARKTLSKSEALFAEARKSVDNANLEKVSQLKGVLGKIQNFINDESVRAFAAEGKELISETGTFALGLGGLVAH